MTTQAQLIAQKQAEALEEFAAGMTVGTAAMQHTYESALSKAYELRAQAEAAQPTKEAAPGVDQTPVSDAEQSALYSFCGGTPHYDVARKLYRLAYAHVNQAAAQPEKEGETPRTDTLEEKFSPAFDGYVDFHGLMHEVREIEADLNQANAYAVALENENKNGAMLYACVANERDELALKLSAHHPDSGEWQAARSHQAQAVEGRERERAGLLEAARLLRLWLENPLTKNAFSTILERDAGRIVYGWPDRLEEFAATPPTQQEALAPVGEPIAIGERFWLWKNFVDGKPEYWAFDNPYPAYASGDPMTLGEPCGYALVRPSTNARPDASEADVLAAIERSIPSPKAVPEGFVFVPKEPSAEMVKAADDLFLENASFFAVAPAQIRAIYEAMLAAAPKDQQP